MSEFVHRSKGNPLDLADRESNMITILCAEPEGNPNEIQLTLARDETACVYLLDESAERSLVKLRRVVIRRELDQAPPNSAFLFSVTPHLSEREPPGLLRVRELDPRVQVEVARDGGLSRLSAEMDLSAFTSLQLVNDGQSISFSLELRGAATRGHRVVTSGLSSRRSWTAASATSTLWLVPTLAGTLASPKARLVGWVTKRVKALGLSPGVAAPAAIALVSCAAMGWYALSQRGAAAAAEAREQEARARAEIAEQSRDAAMLAEAECLEERRDLAAEVSEDLRKVEAAVEVALRPGVARTLAVEIGGARMSGEAVLALDTLAAADLSSEIARLQANSSLEGPPRCLEHISLLGRDLPTYALLWHPDPDQICPENYRRSDGQVTREGAWGLSERVAGAYGPPASISEVEGELRASDRWSAVTLATGLRVVQSVMLSAGEADRPAVLPGQSQLWALALWDALNRMPSPAEGAMDAPPEACVEALLRDLQARRSPSGAGEPILPDIAHVAEGTLPVVASSECPWPQDALERGASAALRAAAHLTKLTLLSPS